MTTIYTHNLDEINQSFSNYLALNEQYNENAEENLGEQNTINFFKTFSYSTIISQNIIKQNTANVFNDANNENTFKSTVIALLNKLNAKNISKIIHMLREIEFKTVQDLHELVSQCITKIKRDSEQTKPITAMLCYELRTLFFKTETSENIYFKNILLSKIKDEYLLSIDFDNEQWNKDNSEKTTILIGVLYNNKIVTEPIIMEIINDYKNKITFVSGQTTEFYVKKEFVFSQLFVLLSSIIFNGDTIGLFTEMEKFINGEISKYKEQQCISKKIQLICKNLFSDITTRHANC